MRLPLLVASVVLLPGSASFAQGFHVPNPGSGTTVLTGDRPFRTGDDPAWAAVTFNDTQ